MFSSSKGRVPHRRAYKITPQLHTSTSGPAYNLPEITYKENNQVFELRSLNKSYTVYLNTGLGKSPVPNLKFSIAS